MSDDESTNDQEHGDAPEAHSDATAEQAPEPEAPTAPAAPHQLAKVITLATTSVKGFTLGKGQTVEGVKLEMAKHLESKGEVRILDITTAP
jgi:hypothetical protein